MLTSTKQGNATPDPHTGETRVYGGDCGLIHVPDGSRGAFAADLAGHLDSMMRAVATREAWRRGDSKALLIDTGDKLDTDSLCPGCYMVVGYDMLVHLARVNGQDVGELARTMIHEFQRLLADPSRPLVEHVQVQEV
jgi:hypothetical protein